MANLIILAGIPGSGKSTWAQTFFDLKYKRVSSDAIRSRLFTGKSDAHNEERKEENNARVFEEFHAQIRDALRHSVDVIADATALHEFARCDLRRHGAIRGTRLHLVLFNNVAQAVARNSARPEETRVPADAMEKFIRRHYDTLSALLDGGEAALYETVTHINSF